MTKPYGLSLPANIGTHSSSLEIPCKISQIISVY
jgi:hypothetical protein